MHQLFRRSLLGNKKGFTLMEILVAVVIIGIFGAVAASAVPRMVNSSKQRGLTNQLATLQQAVDRFYADKGAFPVKDGISPDETTTLGGEIINDGAASVPDYLLSVLKEDPRPYGLPQANIAVKWGVVCNGMVFATQAPPANGAWNADQGTVRVFTAPESDGAKDDGTDLTLNDIKKCNAAPAGKGGAMAYTLQLTAAAEEAQVGTAIKVTAKVMDKATAITGAKVQIKATGSVTGDKFYTVTTGADGTAQVDVTTTEPEYITVSGQIQP